MADDLGIGLPLLVLGLGGHGGGGLRRRQDGRDRLAGRARVEEEDGDDGRHDGDDGDDPSESALGLLLRHGPDASTCADRVDTGGPSAHPRGGVLLWVERNRRWLIPWISALIVVAIETAAWVFSERPIPVEGHAVLGAFWVYAVGRGASNALQASQHQRRLELYAARRGISLDAAADEWDAFLAAVERPQLPPDRGGPP